MSAIGQADHNAVVATVERPDRTTHEVTNQPTPLENFNSFEQDRPMIEALSREGAGWADGRAREWGKVCGSAQVIRWGFEANERKPVLHTHDRFGKRIDEVEFDSSWHELLRLGIAEGLHASPWREPGPGAHVARASLFMLLMQAEGGVGCPISMTYSAIPALRQQPELAAEWEDRFLSLDYDERSLPAERKSGALCGMAMTEKQGGSDVRANTTTATPLNGGGPGAEYEIVGHKWFCSAPMCDAFLVLAQTESGISCFLMPRWTPDGERNAFHIQRLKDKLGNRSNASSEVEFRRAWARMVGEEGRGVPTIIEMVNHTRLDCVIGTAAGMRAAVARATWHAAHRSAFGNLLADQPLMRNVLADLALECEGDIALVMRLAHAFDTQQDEAEGLLRRVLTPVAKYWVCKRAPAVVAEAMEVLGGTGYVEEASIARRFRESPLNSIWEGSGNVMCLDVLRALSREPRTRDALMALLAQVKGRDARYDRFFGALHAELGDLADAEARARHLTEKIALAVQAAVLLLHGPEKSAQAFLASRLTAGPPAAFGTLPHGLDLGALMDRVFHV